MDCVDAVFYSAVIDGGAASRIQASITPSPEAYTPTHKSPRLSPLINQVALCVEISTYFTALQVHGEDYQNLHLDLLFSWEAFSISDYSGFEQKVLLCFSLD